GRDGGKMERGHRPPRPHRDDLRLSGQGERQIRDRPIADAEIRQSEDGQLAGAAAVRTPAAKSAFMPSRLTRRSCRSISKITRSSGIAMTAAARSAVRWKVSSTKW